MAILRGICAFFSAMVIVMECRCRDEGVKASELDEQAKIIDRRESIFPWDKQTMRRGFRDDELIQVR